MNANQKSEARILSAPILWSGTFLAALSIYFLVQYPRGIDTNWDLQNYHLADWILLIRGHYFDHVAPAGIQSFFSPFINAVAAVPLQLLGVRVGGMAIAALHSAIMASTVVLLAKTNIGQDLRLRGYDKIAAAIAAVLLAVTAAMPVGTLGTSFADPSITLLIAIAALETLRVGLVPNIARGCRVALILSVCVALKPTTLPFAIANGISLYLVMIATGQRAVHVVREAIAFCVTSCIMTAALAGGWMWRIYAETGNPLFPFANAIFKSPLTYPADMSDDRFLPKSMLDFLSYPWKLAISTANVSEVGFADSRYLILIVVGLLLACFAALRRIRGSSQLPRPALDAATWFLLADFALSLLIWRFTSSVQRYLVFADLLLAILLVRMAAAFPRFLVTPTLCLIVAAHLSSVRFPDWGHRPILQTPTSEVIARTPLMDDALVILGEKPMGHVVGWFGDRSRFILVSVGSVRVDIDTTAAGPFASRVHALIERPFSNGIWIVFRERGAGIPVGYLSAYKLKATTECRDLRTFVEDFKVCRLAKF